MLLHLYDVIEQKVTIELSQYIEKCGFFSCTMLPSITLLQSSIKISWQANSRQYYFIKSSKSVQSWLLVGLGASFQADEPFGAVGEIGCQTAGGDCEVETTSGKAGYLVGLEREYHAIRGQGGNWQHDLNRHAAISLSKEKKATCRQISQGEA